MEAKSDAKKSLLAPPLHMNKLSAPKKVQKDDSEQIHLSIGEISPHTLPFQILNKRHQDMIYHVMEGISNRWIALILSVFAICGVALSTN